MFEICRICNKRIWFDNVKNWASPTEFDLCCKCYMKTYNVENHPYWLECEWW